jgi:hypothetical protein
MFSVRITGVSGDGVCVACVLRTEKSMPNTANNATVFHRKKGEPIIKK